MNSQKLRTAIDQLKSELELRATPEYEAFSSLKYDSNSGATGLVYSDKAIFVWERINEANPDDIKVTHHLAIMYHARAMDRELSKDAAEISRSESDWFRSFSFWHTLWQSDAFWDCLTKDHVRDSSDENPFFHLRHSLPRELFQIQFDMVASQNFPQDQARKVIRIFLDSKFEKSDKDAVREFNYKSVIDRLPVAIWEPDNTAVDVIMPGLEAIRRYLESDNTYLPAIKDLVVLGSQVMGGFINLIRADGLLRDRDEISGSDKDHILKLKNLDKTCDGYIRFLEENLSELELDKVERVGVWNLALGMVYFLDSKHLLAQKHMERALRAFNLGKDLDNIRMAQEGLDSINRSLKH